MSTRKSASYAKSSINPFDSDTFSSSDNDINASLSDPLLNHSSNVNDSQLDTIYALSPQQLRESYNSYEKHILLVCICFFTFASYFNFDLPGAIQEQLHQQFGKWYDTTDTLILYSVYSVPNCVLALFGGFLIDQVTGVRVGSVLFCSLVTAGSVLFAIGVQSKQFWLCVVGRAVFGLGGESLTVAQNAITVKWYKASQLSLLFGIVIAMSRIGSAVNFAVTPLLVERLDVTTAVWIATSTCIVSLAACTTAAYLDSSMTSVITAERDSIVSTLPEYTKAAVTQHDILTNADASNSENAVTLADVQFFPKSAWMLFIICSMLYIPVLTFNQIASEIIQHAGYDMDTASQLVAIPNFVAIVAVPTFGKLVGQTGYALYAIGTAAAMTLGTQAMFLGISHLYIDPQVVPYIMMWQGLAYSLGASSVWPILSYVVDGKMLGTAYGMQTSVQQIGQVLAPLALSLLPTRDGDFTLPCVFFAATSLTTMLLTGILIAVDAQNGNLLNMSGSERAKLQQSMFQDGDLNFTAYLDTKQDDDYT